MTWPLVLISETSGDFRIERLDGSGDDDHLAALQKLVGGYIEAVVGGWGVLYINEEGKLSGLPVNESSTMLLEVYMPGFSRHDVLVGNGVWIGENGSGDVADVRAEVIEAFVSLNVARADSSIKVICAGQDNVQTFAMSRSSSAIAMIVAAAGESRDNPDFGPIRVEVSHG